MLASIQRLVIRIGLLPADVALSFVGPRYRLYFWFFSLAPPSWIAWLARLRTIRAADHAARKVPAYRAFLASNRCPLSRINNHDLPNTDKENYVTVYPPDERCVNGRLPERATAIDESSGSTGAPFNWIRSEEERHVSHFFISHFARYAFGDGPWITINAFSMGAWATGMNMGVALQHNSVVKSTGPDLDKVFSTLRYFGPRHTYLVCGYPPFLKHLIDVAHERSFPLEDYTLMALLGGEGNSEGLRDYLHQYFRPVFSGYGATDIEIGLAGETPVSLAIRRAARDDQALRQALFGADSRLPMVFQFNPLMHHVEANEAGELIFTITRLNVLTPRIRYNIHDEGGVATFKDMERWFRRAGRDLHALEIVPDVKPIRMPFLWVYGRKDSTVSVMGANIYPEDIEECLYAEPELARVTTSYCLGLKELPDGAVRPQFSFEVRAEVGPDLQRRFEDRILARLLALNLDVRKAFDEYPETVTPVIDLHPTGTGPFAADSTKIKQTRLLRQTAEPAAPPAGS